MCSGTHFLNCYKIMTRVILPMWCFSIPPLHFVKQRRKSAWATEALIKRRRRRCSEVLRWYRTPGSTPTGVFVISIRRRRCRCGRLEHFAVRLEASTSVRERIVVGRLREVRLCELTASADTWFDLLRFLPRTRSGFTRLVLER